MSRPRAINFWSSVASNSPVLLSSAPPVGFGTILAQNAWLPVLRTLRVRPWFGGRLMVSRAGSIIDAEDGLTDDATRQRLSQGLRGFVELAGR